MLDEAKLLALVLSQQLSEILSELGPLSFVLWITCFLRLLAAVVESIVTSVF